jgi:hypothetical protein
MQLCKKFPCIDRWVKSRSVQCQGRFQSVVLLVRGHPATLDTARRQRFAFSGTQNTKHAGFMLIFVRADHRLGKLTNISKYKFIIR